MAAKVRAVKTVRRASLTGLWRRRDSKEAGFDGHLVKAAAPEVVPALLSSLVNRQLSN